MHKFSQFAMLAWRVQLKLPVSTTLSRTTNLWCILAGESSKYSGTPASASRCTSDPRTSLCSSSTMILTSTPRACARMTSALSTSSVRVNMARKSLRRVAASSLHIRSTCRPLLSGKKSTSGGCLRRRHLQSQPAPRDAAKAANIIHKAMAGKRSVLGRSGAWTGKASTKPLRHLSAASAQVLRHCSGMSDAAAPSACAANLVADAAPAALAPAMGPPSDQPCTAAKAARSGAGAEGSWSKKDLREARAAGGQAHSAVNADASQANLAVLETRQPAVPHKPPSRQKGLEVSAAQAPHTSSAGRASSAGGASLEGASADAATP
mmetsp:Transcript_148648/g.378209  ORF Transcript_148648/g.378209 Transcript_148648/m.378209 type:complete len:322 (+) Transcript_148648:1020-1985(+)